MTMSFQLLCENSVTNSKKILAYGRCDLTQNGNYNSETMTVHFPPANKRSVPWDLRDYIIYWNVVTEDYEQGSAIVWVSPEIEQYLGENVVWTDSVTGMKGHPVDLMAFSHERELYNNGPLAVVGFSGVVARAGNLDTIHGKLGWHNQQVLASLYKAPKNLLVYYGWINSFNSATNGWDNEKVAQDMCKYDLIVFGNGIQDPSHGDYSNSQIVVARIKALKPSALIFGYVDLAQSLSTVQTKVDQWNTLGVHGIFFDQAGYDYGTTTTNSRAAFNEKVDYVHGRSSANKVFANAWNTNHILGLANDTSFPNGTWNAGLAESSLNILDWILLESYPINDTAYTASTPDGYEPKADWASRGVTAEVLRSTYGVNFAAVGIISNGNGIGQDLFDFLYASSLVWSLEAVGSSDTSYGSSSAAVAWWDRTNIGMLPSFWSLSPSVQVDVGDSDVYHRFGEGWQLALDFSSSAQSAIITPLSVIANL